MCKRDRDGELVSTSISYYQNITNTLLSDIVDTKHCDDHVPSIVVGSFSSYADEMGSSEEGRLMI